MPDDQIKQQLRDVQRRMEALKQSRAWDVALKALIPIVVAIGAWLVGVEVRVSNIEQSRYTHADGRALEDRVSARMYPAWLRDDLQEIKAMVRGLDERLREVEKK